MKVAKALTILFTSEWLKSWRTFLSPVTELSKAKLTIGVIQ